MFKKDPRQVIVFRPQIQNIDFKSCVFARRKFGVIKFFTIYKL